MANYRHGYRPPLPEKWEMPLRKWEVADDKGNHHIIQVHFCFNNGDEGLVFRTYPQGSERTEVTAAFAQGGWKFYKETTNV